MRMTPNSMIEVLAAGGGLSIDLYQHTLMPETMVELRHRGSPRRGDVSENHDA